MSSHDYHQNPQAQIDYYVNKRDNRWIMPAHSYNLLQNITLSNGTIITTEIIFIDTPILCPTETKETSTGGIHEVTEAQSSAELAKIEGMLSASQAHWLLVAGHYTSKRRIPCLLSYLSKR